MKMTLAFAIATLGLFCTVPSGAHHSVTATFDFSSTTRVSGTVTRVEWRNPHVVFYLRVADPGGGVAIWNLEMRGPNALAGSGLQQDALAIGQPLVADVWVARDGMPRGNARTLTLADGRSFEVGDNWDRMAPPRQ